MKKNNVFFYFLIVFFMCLFINHNTVVAEENISVYDGELGFIYSNTGTKFNIWSSSASSIKVVIENNEQVVELTKNTANLWSAYVAGDLLNKSYTYTISYSDGTTYENVLDPYGKYLNETSDKNIIYEDSLVGFNSWYDQVNNLNIADIKKIIYGINVKTFSSGSTWNGAEENRGNLLGLIEGSTKYSGIPTGYDYIKSLGVGYVEISDLFENSNPFIVNKNIVSGDNIYSGNLELKEVVNGYYLNGIGIIGTFDFNGFHNAFYENLNKIDREYYLENNKLDYTKQMVKKYVTDLIVYRVTQYKLEGIRLDGIGNIDYSLINTITSKLKELNENIVIYANGNYTIEKETTAGENNIGKVDNVSYINQSLNYAMLGDLNSSLDKGILAGNYNQAKMESLKFTFLSGVDNGDINYDLVEGISYKKEWNINNSFDVVNVIGSRDGLSFYDKLYLSGIVSDNKIKQKIILAYGTLMSSGGIPYIVSGNEFLISNIDATKNAEGKSVCDQENEFCFYTQEDKKIIDWSYAYRYKTIVDSFKSLINFRKTSKNIIQTLPKILKNSIEIYQDDNLEGVIGYIRTNKRVYAKEIEKVVVLFNYSEENNVINGFEGNGWKSLYNYNQSEKEDVNVNLYGNSIYMGLKIKQPKVSSWFSLIFVLAIIGGLYYFNLLLNKRLVEKEGYDIKEIKKKYRPFIKRSLNKKENKEEIIVDNEIDDEEKDKDE